MILTRNAWVFIHRYTGLFLMIFVFQVGFTGALLSFYDELDHIFLGTWADATPTGPQLPRETLVAAAEAAYPGTIVNGGGEDMADHPASSVTLYVESTTDTPPPVTKVFVNPYTAEVYGGRVWGAIVPDAVHFMPMMYRLHYALLVQDWDGWGFWLMGIVGLVWAIDHIAVLFISFPKRGPLWKALTVKWTGAAYRINVDLHRAGGLIFWVILVMLAITGMSWNATFFGTNLVRAPIEYVSPSRPYPMDTLPARAEPLHRPEVSSIDARTAFIAAANAAGHATADLSDIGVWYDADKGAYGGYATLGTFGTQWYEAAIDGMTGAVLATLDPRDYTMGNVLNNWMYPLHSGQAFGLAGRILICLAGIFTSVVTVTGLIIFLKKWRARRAGAARRQTPRAHPAE